jgi:hypothetical protein
MADIHGIAIDFPQAISIVLKDTKEGVCTGEIKE